VTNAGQFVGLARFESEAAARHNSNRPEQDRWWAQTAKLFDGEVSFSDSINGTTMLTGQHQRDDDAVESPGRERDQRGAARGIRVS
jgi:hypothetical protein